MVRELLAVGIGGFSGAIGRYLISGWVHRFTGAGFPWGTLVVNVIGCFALGALMASVDAKLVVDPRWRLILGLGFLGSLTTYSTFGYETVELLRRSELVSALANVAGSMVLGLAAVVSGAMMVRWLVSP